MSSCDPRRTSYSTTPIFARNQPDWQFLLSRFLLNRSRTSRYQSPVHIETTYLPHQGYRYKKHATYETGNQPLHHWPPKEVTFGWPETCSPEEGPPVLCEGRLLLNRHPWTCSLFLAFIWGWIKGLLLGQRPRGTISCGACIFSRFIL